jgi:hypothetical protein
VCYSAQIRASYKHYVRAWGADISIKEFVRLYWLRSQGAKIKIPKAMDAAFADPQTDEERRIKTMIDAFDAQQATNIEQELFRPTRSNGASVSWPICGAHNSSTKTLGSSPAGTRR